MSTKIKAGAGIDRATGISAESIADGANSAGTGIDNATNRDRMMSAEIAWSFAVAPTPGKTLRMWIEYAHDGTNYEDAAPDAGWIADIVPPADTASHRLLVARDWPLLALPFRFRLANVDTGQAVAATLVAHTYCDVAEST